MCLQNVYFVFGIAVSILFLKAARFDPWPESGRQSVEWLKNSDCMDSFQTLSPLGKLVVFLWANCSTAKWKHIETHGHFSHLFTADLLHPVLQGQALQQWCRDFLERHRVRSRAFTFMATYLVLLMLHQIASCSPLFGHVQTYSEHVLPTNWFSSTQVHVFPTSVAQSHPLSHILDRLRWVSAVCLATALVGHARLCTKAGCCGGGTPPAQRRWFEHQLLFNHESEPSNYSHIFSRLI